jgi:glycosyltransferase involved in cell wall biosynthesis
MVNLSIGVPIHNEMNFLPKLLDSLYSIQVEFFPRIEIILIDNNSIDGSREYLTNIGKNKKFKDFRVILNEKNEGFNYSCDSLMASASNDYLWIIGAQDNIYLGGVGKLLKLLDKNKHEYIYVVCNARIRDEVTDKIINESLWGKTNSADFLSLISFFKTLGGPCQAVSCNIFKTDLIRTTLHTDLKSHYWGYYERICDMLIASEKQFKVAFISEPLIEILIEADIVSVSGVSLFGTVPRAEYGPFYTSLELAEIANSKFKNGIIRKSFTVFRDPFAIPRSLTIAKTKGVKLNKKLIFRLIKAYKKSITFWLIGIPMMMMSRRVNRWVLKFMPLIHLLRKVFNIRTF